MNTPQPASSVVPMSMSVDSPVVVVQGLDAEMEDKSSQQQQQQELKLVTLDGAITLVDRSTMSLLSDLVNKALEDDKDADMIPINMNRDPLTMKLLKTYVDRCKSDPTHAKCPLRFHKPIVAGKKLEEIFGDWNAANIVLPLVRNPDPFLGNKVHAELTMLATWFNIPPLYQICVAAHVIPLVGKTAKQIGELTSNRKDPNTAPYASNSLPLKIALPKEGVKAKQ